MATPTEEGDEGGRALWWVFLLMAAPVVAVFLPLLLSVVEHFALGTSHVENFCRAIGVHDALSKIYRPVVDLFR